MAAFRSGGWFPSSGRRCRRSSGLNAHVAQIAAERFAIPHCQALTLVLPRHWAPAGCGSTCRSGLPLCRRAGFGARRRPASARRRDRSARPSRLTLASRGPPGRLSAKHSASLFPWQASTSVVPAVVSMPRSRRIRPRLAATLRLESPQAWMIDGKLASGLAVEDRDQPLVGVPLHGAFGGDPFRAARPASAVRAVRDIEDHGVDRRTDAADRRPVRVLRLRAAGRDQANQPSEDSST